MGCGASTAADEPPSKAKGAGPATENVPSTNRVVSAKDVATGKAMVLPQALPNLRSDYDMREKIGKGSFGVTWVAVSKSSGERRACKVISKKKLSTAEDITDVQREVEILHAVEGHKNVVPLIQVYEDRDNVCLVQELCEGGELFEQITKKGTYSEAIAAGYLRTMLEVIVHVHSMGIVHRDLKPENFLFDTRGPNATLKLIDFGLSAFCKPGEMLTDPVGTPFYTAPEVFRAKYSFAVDTWSLGVIAYVMLSGQAPFSANSLRSIRKKILLGEFNFNGSVWKNISQDAKDFISRILVKKNRPTANELLNDKWVKVDGSAPTTTLTPTIVQRMNEFTGMSKLRKLAAQMMVAAVPADKLVGLEQMFKAFDKDGSGTISVDELRQGLKSMAKQVGGKQMIDDDLQALVANLDLDGNGMLDYREFVSATIHMAKLETDDHILEVFKKLDKNQNGFISPDEIKAAGAELGMDLASELASFMASDKDGDGQVSHDEFIAYIRQNKVKEVYGDMQYKTQDGKMQKVGARKANFLVVKQGEVIEDDETPR